MQSLFTQLASLIVMSHMAIGCQWHHGLGEVGHCKGQCEIAVGDSNHAHEHVAILHDCHHEYGCSGDKRERGDLPTDHSRIGCDLNGSHSGHTGCCNDRCSVTKVAHFELAALNFFDEYLGGAENAALADSIRFQCSVFETMPDFSHTALKMRVHLLISVLIV